MTRLTQATARRWMVLALCGQLALAMGVLAITGVGDDGLRIALRATARLMFALFWLAYAGPALAALFGPAFEPVRRNARNLGLAFAAALFVHLCLVAGLVTIGDPPDTRTFVIFGIGAAAVYAMAVFSIDRLRRMLGERGWALLCVVGMNYVLLAFALDFARDPLSGLNHALFYWPFLALTLLAPVLRFSVWLASRSSSARLRATPQR